MTQTYVEQSGVVPYRWGEGGLEILLITTRRSGRWSLPKGHLEPGMTPQESAENEAWEEGGVQGVVQDHELGIFAYQKLGFGHRTTFYPMLVTAVADTWLEQADRSRRWCPPDKAMALLAPRNMSYLVKALVAWLDECGEAHSAHAGTLALEKT